MPPRSERVAAMVRSELARDPNVGNDVLLKKARSIDPGVRRLSPRQFHATFRLPALRGLRDVAANGGASSKGPAPAKRADAKNAAAKSAPAKSASPAPAAAPAAPTAPVAPAPAPASEAAPPAPAPASAPAAASAPPPASPAPEPAESPRESTTTAVARPGAAQREVVRQILQTVAREALAAEDRASFVRLLDSLDQRAAMIMGLFRKE